MKIGWPSSSNLETTVHFLQWYTSPWLPKQGWHSRNVLVKMRVLKTTELVCFTYCMSLCRSMHFTRITNCCYQMVIIQHYMVHNSDTHSTLLAGDNYNISVTPVSIKIFFTKEQQRFHHRALISFSLCLTTSCFNYMTHTTRIHWLIDWISLFFERKIGSNLPCIVYSG